MGSDTQQSGHRDREAVHRPRRAGGAGRPADRPTGVVARGELTDNRLGCCLSTPTSTGPASLWRSSWPASPATATRSYGKDGRREWSCLLVTLLLSGAGLRGLLDISGCLRVLDEGFKAGAMAVPA